MASIGRLKIERNQNNIFPSLLSEGYFLLVPHDHVGHEDWQIVVWSLEAVDESQNDDDRHQKVEENRGDCHFKQKLLEMKNILIKGPIEHRPHHR
jgi:hypothetical protein